MIKRPLFWLSLPLLLPQGLWVKRTARRLPPAAGPNSGVVGSGPTRRLLLVAGGPETALPWACPGDLDFASLPADGNDFFVVMGLGEPGAAQPTLFETIGA